MPRFDDPTEIEPRPQPPPPPGRSATTAQLRADIVSGATGDKVPAMDPAASPLGTDDEAAGAPPSPGLVAQARHNERRGALDESTRAAGVRQRRLGLWLLAIVAGLVVLGLVAFAIGIRSPY